jgi:hypothetical protein
MNSIFYGFVGGVGEGLANEWFHIVTNVYRCLETGKKVLILGDFLRNFNTPDFCPLSQIIDLPHLSTFIRNTYDIHVLEHQQAVLGISQIVYGDKDVTDVIKEQFWDGTALRIPSSVILNDVFGDPMPFQYKYLHIKFSIGDIVLEEVIPEVRDSDYCLSLMPPPYEYNHIYWPSKTNRWFLSMYKNILQNIHYNPNLIAEAHAFIKPHIQTGKRINVLHLRLEDDGVRHFAGHQCLNPDYYRWLLEEKYIAHIRKYTQPEDINVLLSYSTENRVVDFLQNNGYTYVIRPKNLDQGREVNAILDLIVGTHCTGVLFANFITDNVGFLGSTYSFVLYYMLERKVGVRAIQIDVEHIFSSEELITDF